MAVRAERRAYTVEGWGEGELWFGDGLVLANDFSFSAHAGAPQGTAPTAPRGAGWPPRVTVASTSKRVGHGSVTKRSTRAADPDDVVARVRAFLVGDEVELSDVPLDLEHLSDFQRAVTIALRRVPRGEVVTYGELAALAGRPRAPRAAGSVCAQNRFMFLVPCHRVVAANGIGSYGSAGIGVKRRLLALEGVGL